MKWLTFSSLCQIEYQTSPYFFCSISFTGRKVRSYGGLLEPVSCRICSKIEQSDTSSFRWNGKSHPECRLLIFVTCYCTTEILSQVILRPLSTMPDRIMPLKTKKRRW